MEPSTDKKNALVLANATALCTNVMRRVIGEEVADTLHGEHGAIALRRAITAKLQAHLNKGN